MSSDNLRIYLDYQASTPVDPRVKKSMEPYYDQIFANPHSINHKAGITAGIAVRLARHQIAQAINADANSIFFTSGATEANNLAILGTAKGAKQNRKQIVTLATEHSSVIGPIDHLVSENFNIDILPVLPSGLVDLEVLESVIGKSTLLVSIMHVNNETGVIQPVEKIAKLCRQVGALFHSDCAQSLSKSLIDVESMDLDFATLSSHKTYGPKGIGALYVKSSAMRSIKPITFGGGQERSLRPGTLPVPLCVGFGKACELAVSEYAADQSRISKLTDMLVNGIQAIFPDAKLNGTLEQRVPGCFNICFPGGHSEELLVAFDGIQVSSGSACMSTDVDSSRVLRAYGLSREEADSSLRFGIGRFTTENEIINAMDIIKLGLENLSLARSSQANYKI